MLKNTAFCLSHVNKISILFISTISIAAGYNQLTNRFCYKHLAKFHLPFSICHVKHSIIAQQAYGTPSASANSPPLSSAIPLYTTIGKWASINKRIRCAFHMHILFVRPTIFGVIRIARKFDSHSLNF